MPSAQVRISLLPKGTPHVTRHKKLLGIARLFGVSGLDPRKIIENIFAFRRGRQWLNGCGSIVRGGLSRAQVPQLGRRDRKRPQRLRPIGQPHAVCASSAVFDALGFSFRPDAETPGATEDEGIAAVAPAGRGR